MVIHNFSSFALISQFTGCYRHGLFRSRINRIFLTQTSRDAINEAGLLKSAFPDCTLYTVGFYDDTLNNTVLRKSEDGGLDGNNPHVNEFFYAADADELAVAYEKILSKVYTASQAWTVTDPMPDYVTVDSDFIASLPDSCTWDSASNTLVWDLTKCTPTEEEDESGYMAYTYTLTYTVTVDPTDLEEGTYYPTNLKTTLDYAFTDSGTGELGETQTAEFLVPTVTLETENPYTTTTKRLTEIDGTAVSAGAAVSVGDEITYTITYDAPTGTEKVIIEDALPAGTSYVNSSPTAILSGSSTYQWEIDVTCREVPCFSLRRY